MDYLVVYVNEDTKVKLDELKDRWGVDSLNEVIQILLVGR